MLQCNLPIFDFLLLVLFHSLPHLSFVFSVSRQGSLELSVSHFRRFGTIFFLFVILGCFCNHSLFFCYLLKCIFNVTQICIYSTCFFFISHLCSIFVAQKRIYGGNLTCNGYRKVNTHFKLPPAVVDVRRRPILRSLIRIG